MSDSDFIVVGSGATGSMAAQTLVEKGCDVLMLDAGQTDDRYTSFIPDHDFVQNRRTDPQQHRYFLGDDFESALIVPGSTGAQLTAPRKYIVAQVDRFLPIDSENFSPMESLAFGGLGSGWGLGCCVFSDEELRKAGLATAAMHDAYQIVADRIGMSGTADDAEPYTFSYLGGVQPSVPLDPTASLLHRNYLKRRRRVMQDGFALGRPALALLTRPKPGRGATRLYDMDFYSDADRAAWRPWMTVNALKTNERFRYVAHSFVTRYEEGDSVVRVTTLDMRTMAEKTHICRNLVLACGALGSARVVMRSHGYLGMKRPILSNPFAYVPCIVPARIGKSMPERNTGFAQLVLFYDVNRRNDNVAMASIYSYRSLMLFRLLREVPIDLQDARILMRALMSGLLIMAVQHPENAAPGKYLELRSDPQTPTGDRLHVTYKLTAAEAAAVESNERRYLRVMRGLGAWPIRRIHPGHGSSIHYAGTLPFDEQERPGTLSRSGRVAGARRVFVADGSGFTYLPAKSLTLSLMANAHCVASRVSAAS